MRPEKFTDSIVRAYRAGQDSVLPALQQEQAVRRAAEDTATSWREVADDARRRIEEVNTERQESERQVGEIRHQVARLTTRWSEMAAEFEKSESGFGLGKCAGLERAIEDVLRTLGFITAEGTDVDA